MSSQLGGVTVNESRTQVKDKEAVTVAVTDNKPHAYRYDKEAVTGRYGPKYSVALEAYTHADYCGKCFKVIHHVDPVAIDRVTTTMGGSPAWGHCMTVICLECLALKNTIVRPCVVCGRDIHYRKSYEGLRRYHTGIELCSLKCKWTHRNQQTAKKRLKKSKPAVICDCCGVSFIQTRTDSRYCSNKCRQKAYRQRRPLKNPHLAGFDV